MMFSNSIHLSANDKISFFFILNNIHYIYIYTYIYHIFLIHSSVLGHLDYFHCLAIVNNAAINMGVQVSLLNPGLHSLPRSSIARSYGSSIFSFFEALPYRFHSDCINLHSQKQYIRIPFTSILANNCCCLCS
jgi:hypothetical protein